MSNQNNPYIAARDPIAEPGANVFSRTWFRFFDFVARKIKILDGTQSNSATAGTASPLPATPAGFMTIMIDGVNYKVPYYNE